VFNEGLRVAELTLDGQRRDLTLKGPEEKINSTQAIGSLPVITQLGEIVPVSNLANVILTAGPTEIRHKDRNRVVTIEIRPSPSLPLEVAIDLIEQEIIQPLTPNLPLDISMRLSGTADHFSKT